MTTTATKTYRVYVIERALAHYEVEAEDARDRRRELAGRRIPRPRRRSARHRGPVQRPRAAARRQMAEGAAIGMGGRAARRHRGRRTRGAARDAEGVEPGRALSCGRARRRRCDGNARLQYDSRREGCGTIRAVTGGRDRSRRPREETLSPSCCSTPTTPTTAAARPITPGSRPRTRSPPSPWRSGRRSRPNEWRDIDPDDFAPLLVTQGHHCGQPMSDLNQPPQRKEPYDIQ